MKLEVKIRPSYKQPHNIHYNTGNVALDYHLKNVEHRKQKYNKSKWTKRLYIPNDER